MMFFNAVRKKNVKVLKRILDENPGSPATIYTSHGDSLIHELVASRPSAQRFEEILLLLLEHGANVNAKGCFGQTPLYRAALDEKRIDMVEILIKKGGAVVSEGFVFPLLLGLNSDDEEYFRQLLNVTGVDVNVRDANDKTPLEVSIEKNVFCDTMIKRCNVDDRFNKALTETIVKAGHTAATMHSVLARSYNPRKLYMAPFSKDACVLRSYPKMRRDMYDLCWLWERRMLYWMLVTPRTLEWKRKNPECYIALLPEALVRELVEFLI